MGAMLLSEFVSQRRGAVADLARELVVSGSLITQWARGKPVSAERCPEIERATQGAVRRWDLRPDDWHRIWPELIGAEGAPAVASEEARDAA
jgi:DNA-binding transcriptional regulator YdaS (Cro superfamily)